MSFDPPANARPKRSLGQVFLNSGRVVARIAAALEPAPGDTIVEIGPGRGALTAALAPMAESLVLVEKDTDLAAALAGRFAGDDRVRVVEADATQVDLDALVPGGAPLRVAGNLPYNVGGQILFHWLRQRRRIARMVLMFQKEVAVRLSAGPGDREYGAASLLAQARGRVRYLFDVSPAKFVPQPKIWSGVIEVTPAPADDPLALAADDPAFERFVHGLHAQPRKTVLNSLSDGLAVEKARLLPALEAAGIDPGVRPALVTPQQALAAWRALPPA